MARKERYLVGLDVGTSTVSAIVGEVMDDGGLDIIGIGLAESKGIRRGVVNNVDSAAEAIKKALDEAELTAGVEVDSVILALSGAHVKAFNSRGVVAVAGRVVPLDQADLERLVGKPQRHADAAHHTLDAVGAAGRSDERGIVDRGGREHLKAEHLVEGA